MIGKIIAIIMGVLVAGMVVLLCLFSCILSNLSDKFWEEEVKELEKHKNERR